MFMATCLLSRNIAMPRGSSPFTTSPSDVSHEVMRPNGLDATMRSVSNVSPYFVESLISVFVYSMYLPLKYIPEQSSRESESEAMAAAEKKRQARLIRSRVL